MADDYRDDDRRRGDRDRDRDRWDVRPERPSDNTMEAAEDVQGLLRVAVDVANDEARGKADSALYIAVYNWIREAREL